MHSGGSYSSHGDFHEKLCWKFTWWFCCTYQCYSTAYIPSNLAATILSTVATQIGLALLINSENQLWRYSVICDITRVTKYRSGGGRWQTVELSPQRDWLYHYIIDRIWKPSTREKISVAQNVTQAWHDSSLIKIVQRPHPPNFVWHFAPHDFLKYFPPPNYFSRWKSGIEVVVTSALDNYRWCSHVSFPVNYYQTWLTFGT